MLRIVAGGMIVVDGIVIHHVIIANGTVIAAGVTIATVIVIGSISSRAVAVRIIKERKEQRFRCSFYTGSVCVPEIVSICGKTSGVMGASTSMTRPLGAKFTSQLAFNSPVNTEYSSL